MRYRGQGYEIRADLPRGDVVDGYADAVAEAFHGAHERSYGYRDPGAAL